MSGPEKLGPRGQQLQAALNAILARLREEPELAEALKAMEHDRKAFLWTGLVVAMLDTLPPPAALERDRYREALERILVDPLDAAHWARKALGRGE